MIQATCIHKFRDKQNKIYGYRLQDINQQTQDVTPEDLKRAILNNQINVVNLTLTRDGRLIDKTPEKQLENKKIMPNKPEPPRQSKKELVKEDMVNFLEKLASKLAEAVIQYESAYDRRPFVEFEGEDATSDYILGSIYDLTFNEDYNMYGLTFGISELGKQGTDAFVIFQEDCMGDPVFEYSVDLTYPLNSAENLTKIKELYNRTYKSIKAWVDKGYPPKVGMPSILTKLSQTIIEKYDFTVNSTTPDDLVELNKDTKLPFHIYISEDLTNTEASGCTVSIGAELPAGKLEPSISGIQFEKEFKIAYPLTPDKKNILMQDLNRIITNIETVRDAKDILKLITFTAQYSGNLISGICKEKIQRLCAIYNIPFESVKQLIKDRIVRAKTSRTYMDKLKQDIIVESSKALGYTLKEDDHLSNKLIKDITKAGLCFLSITLIKENLGYYAIRYFKESSFWLEMRD